MSRQSLWQNSAAPQGVAVQEIRATFYVWSGNEIIAEYNESGQMLYQYAYANGRRIAQLKE